MVGVVGDAHSLLVVGGIWGVTSVKIRVAIGVPARYGWVNVASVLTGLCGCVLLVMALGR